MHFMVSTFWVRTHERRRRSLFCGRPLLLLTVLWMGAACPSSAEPATALPPSTGAQWHLSTVPQEAQNDVPYDLERSAERYVNRTLVRSAALYFTCFGMYLLIGLIFLIYWRWMRRDFPVLAVGLLSLLMAVHTAAISGSMTFLVTDLFDPYTSGMVETVSYLLLNGFIAFMLWAFFPNEFRPGRSDWIHMLTWTIAGAAVLTSLLFAAAALVFGGEAVVYVLSASRWIMALLMIVVVALALQALEQRSDFGLVTAAGLALIVVGSIHDILFAGGGLDDRPYMITFAMLGFVLLQSYVMMRRSAEATQKVHLSSRRLQREVDARTKELRAASVAAEAANIAKTEFVTAVTHELRTPLTSLLGYTQLLHEEAGEDLAPQHREFLNLVRVSGERLLKLVNDLLDLARIESGRLSINIDDVDIETVLNEVKNQLYPLAAEKDLYIRSEVVAQNPVARADEDRLCQVLINLVSNGLKFTSAGGVTMRVVDAELNGVPAIRIDVKDTGAGVASEFIPHLFERFTRWGETSSDQPSGSGLGLTIARELTVHMQGKLTMESEVGNGSTFAVVLPRA